MNENDRIVYQHTHELKVEEYKDSSLRNIEEYKAANESRLEMFRSALQAGTKTIQAVFILNGAASIALLTFIGSLTSTKPEIIPDFALTLKYFVIGVFSAGLSAGILYCTQTSYYLSVERESESQRKLGNAFNIAGITSVVASYVFFAIGVNAANDAFLKMGVS